MNPLSALLRRLTSAVLCLLMFLPGTLLDGAAFAQQPPSGGTFSAETNLVLVPVVVTDKSGQHVGGLKAADFTIRDEGKPQTITSFEEVTQVPAKMTHPAPAGVFTNAVDSPAAAHGMTIIVLDQVNTPFLDQVYARAQLLKFLAAHVSSNEPTALIMIGRRGVRVIHDFTTDTSVLIAALQAVSSRSDTLATGTDTTKNVVPSGNAGPAISPDGIDRSTLAIETSALDDFYNGTDGGYGAYQLTQAIEITLSALSHIAQAFEGIPGRKSVIWATGGFPFTLTTNGELSSLRYYTTGATRAELGGQTAGGVIGSSGNLPPMPESNATTSDDLFAAVRPLYQRTMQALNKANIAIYPIDARGLVAYSTAASSRVRINDVYGTEAQVHTTMNDIAEVTGGKAYYNTNDITGAFSKATNESAQYYMLGYYAPKGEKKPGWHKLQVKLERPGVEVRARVGYMSGVPTNAKKPDELRNIDIRAALASPLDYTALPLSVRFLGKPAAGSGNKKKVAFEVIVLPGAASIDTGNKNRISLDFVIVARTPQGDAAGQLSQKIESNLPDGALKIIAAEGMNYSQTFEVPPGSYQVRFIVRDNLSNKIGSVIAPLQVN